MSGNQVYIIWACLSGGSECVQYQRLALPHLKQLCFIEALRLPGGKNGDANFKGQLVLSQYIVWESILSNCQ